LAFRFVGVQAGAIYEGCILHRHALRRLSGGVWLAGSWLTGHVVVVVVFAVFVVVVVGAVGGCGAGQAVPVVWLWWVVYRAPLCKPLP
jgi:hypothetical protein